MSKRWTSCGIGAERATRTLSTASSPVRCAVLGSPISHSRSPALHRAAYGVLGLAWSYDAIDVTAEALPSFLDSLDASWRGLSLTMPLKTALLPLLDETDEIARLTGGANTALLGDGRVRGFNTDVYGIVQAIRSAGIDEIETAQILGGGATAASAVVALQQLGALRIVVSVRTPAKAERLAVLGAELGVNVVVRGIGEADDGKPDAVVSTLPGRAESGIEFSEAVRARAVLLDVAYDPWPSALATRWLDANGTVVPGIDMLLHQALAQVRIFVGGDSDIRLPGEERVFDAMRASVGGA